MASPISGLQSHELQCMGLTFRKVYSKKTTVFKEEELKDAIKQKWREISESKRQFCLEKKGCVQFAIKAEATSITCSISQNMSMTL